MSLIEMGKIVYELQIHFSIFNVKLNVLVRTMALGNLGFVAAMIMLKEIYDKANLGVLG